MSSMPALRPFRTALYLSLGLGVFGLGLAGGDLLPEIPYLTGLALVLLGIAYYLEGRWQLSLRDANIVGLALAGLLLLWGVFQIVRPPTGLTDTLPWPASALPYLAAVLMILIPAKMFRPKHSGDYWAMHGLALLAMAMACALAQDGVFALVFAGFAVAFVWSLTGFHLVREAGPAAADRPLAGGRWRALKPAVLWAAVTGIIAVPLFWATPRSGGQWELGLNSRGRVTGLADGPVDLNTSGPVAVNREKAFEVYVEDRDGRPVIDLPVDLKFRAAHLQTYDAGRWGRNQFSSLQTADRSFSPQGVGQSPRERLPDLGPNARYLTFVLEPRLTRTPPLADPIAWATGKYVPAVSRFDEHNYRSWLHRHDGSLDGAFNLDGSPPQYVQAWLPPLAPGVGQTMRIVPGNTAYLLRIPGTLNRLRKYTDDLIARLVADGTLPPGVLTVDQYLARDPKYHEAIARALEHHLAASGEFTYTLDLTRKDKAIDPAEDFLLNTKAGHCQRFATALTLMLRTQGIPAQMVIGYRGCESRGDGWYDVREDQSHAWTEVLVPAPWDGLPPAAEVAPAFGEWHQVMQSTWQLTGAVAVPITPTPAPWTPMRWVTLDPTPSGPGDDDTAAGTLFTQARQRWEAVFKALLLTYNAESREQAAEAVGTWIRDDGGAYYLAGGAAALFALWAWRRRVRRQRAKWAGIPDPLKRLTAILTTAGYAWRPGQTAREWAQWAGLRLRLATRTVEVAGVPERVVSAYYAERFGGRSVGPAERQELDGEVGRLAVAVA
jgi:transglutaminase-like putative cysteine protease